MNEILNKFKDIYVLFPPKGELRLEMKFFLKYDGQNFYEFYKKICKGNLGAVYYDSYEKYLTEFLLPHLKEFKEIRLGLDSFSGKTSWFGDKKAGGEWGIALAPVNFNFYEGAAKYKKYNA
ncbi:hypothetical protein PY093_20640 [Cytobacillus sp. S13-E01]|uniref:hypothetical protein n=1 Tax=Cytobacillus sp. S13-E01 TaxID=3031326 RepID=UPI0023D80B45|nr:hypothetical protein [Cytobacillus sp. S13-E01]MDF0729018.1 hypothetical protein [Cytobacillus sp. S13-E01]